ncbi:SRPBCC family protein [Nocardioides campestrisoli]|uniref:SRPBCC family protein n=1 Tax=Nocardioides campestrisoli TaxID=2736757 RepID=UPI00163DA911|nr:SRPBCC family protein [Nocardioides campestrisoli]
MELTHTFSLPLPVETAWAEFQDIGALAECFPGATVTRADLEGFEGSVKVKLGPIALVYNGAGTFVERDGAAYRMVIEARGKDRRGNGTAAAQVVLTMGPEGIEGSNETTEVAVRTDLSITGKPAQFGRGLMQDVSDRLLGQFVACLEERHAATSGAPAPAVEVDVEVVEVATGVDGMVEMVGVAVGEVAPTEAAPAEATPAEVDPAEVDPGPGADQPEGRASFPGSADAIDLGGAVLPALARRPGTWLAAGVLLLLVVAWGMRRRH